MVSEGAGQRSYSCDVVSGKVSDENCYLAPEWQDLPDHRGYSARRTIDPIGVGNSGLPRLALTSLNDNPSRGEHGYLHSSTGPHICGALQIWPPQRTTNLPRSN